MEKLIIIENKKVKIKQRIMNINIKNVASAIKILNKKYKKYSDLIDSGKIIIDIVKRQNFLDQMKLPVSLKYTIYIPSKINAIKCVLPRILLKYNIPFKLVVEPQDAISYINKWGKDNIIILPENDKGLSFSRNFILQYSRKIGEKKHWQLDDDIGGFSIFKNNISSSVNPTRALKIIENTCDNYLNIGIAGPSNQAFPPQGKIKEIQYNKLIASCMLFDNSCKQIYFEIDRVEDIDCCLTVLFTKKYCTFKFLNVLMTKANDLQFSGNYSSLEKYKLAVNKIMEKRPGVFTLNKNGRLRTNIWNIFKQKPILKYNKIYK